MVTKCFMGLKTVGYHFTHAQYSKEALYWLTKEFEFFCHLYHVLFQAYPITCPIVNQISSHISCASSSDHLTMYDMKHNTLDIAMPIGFHLIKFYQQNPTFCHPITCPRYAAKTNHVTIHATKYNDLALECLKLAINSYSASRDNWCTVGGDGGCRVGEVRAGTTSPMLDHKGFKLQ